LRWSSEHPDYGGIGVPEVVNDGGWRIPGHAAVVLRAGEPRADGEAATTEQ
jgi:maltooligosyltrehalose trehalohydrolase